MATTSNDAWQPNCGGMDDTDAKFLVGKGNSKRIFHVHKSVILASGSRVFEQMFQEIQDEKETVIELPDDPQDFELLLNHFYGYHHKIKSLKSIWNFFAVGKKYEVPKILDIAKQYIRSTEISEDDFFDEIESKNFTHPLFLQKMLSYLKENACSLIISERFLNVPEKIVDGILQMDKLYVEEYDLLVAVTEWAYQNLKCPSPQNLRKFYKHIRFSCLTSDEYFQFINCYPEAIEAESSLQILMYLYFLYTHSLPNWCTSNEASRKDEFLKEESKLMFNGEA